MNFYKYIERTTALVKQRKFTVFSTETVLGLSANTHTFIAILKFFAIGQCSAFVAFIVHISKLKQLNVLSKKVDNTIRNFADNLWPGTLSRVVNKNNKIHDILISGLIRLIDNGFVLFRPGAITLSGSKKECLQITLHDSKEDKLSPGLLETHYCNKNLYFLVPGLIVQRFFIDCRSPYSFVHQRTRIITGILRYYLQIKV